MQAQKALNKWPNRCADFSGIADEDFFDGFS
jgi:hypothetical protein